jgi:hypothetical protein
MEMWEDLYMTRAEIIQEIEAGTGDLANLTTRLNKLDKLLGEKSDVAAEDPLIAKWDAEWEAGIVSNLEEVYSGGH